MFRTRSVLKGSGFVVLTKSIMLRDMYGGSVEVRGILCGVERPDLNEMKRFRNFLAGVFLFISLEGDFLDVLKVGQSYFLCCFMEEVSQLPTR